MLLVVFLLLVLTSVSSEKTVFGKLKSGFELASKLLGVDRANGVAQLVSETFGKSHKKGDGSEGTSNIFSGFLRVLGFDSKKIGAIAVNAIIFVAQLISSSLSGPLLNEGRTVKEGSPLDWLMGSPEVIKLFTHIKDKSLPEHIIMYIKERSLDEDTACIQLLICKGAPFVWGMQKSLDSNGTTVPKGPKSLYAYLPSLDEVIDNSDHCDRKHPFCFIHV